MRISDWSSDVCSSDLVGRTAKSAAVRTIDGVAAGGFGSAQFTSPEDSLTTTIDDIRAAAERLQGQVIRTPLVPAARMSEVLGCELYLKLENLQDRKRVVEGKSVSIRVYLGGGGIRKKKK